MKLREGNVFSCMCLSVILFTAIGQLLHTPLPTPGFDPCPDHTGTPANLTHRDPLLDIFKLVHLDITIQAAPNWLESEHLVFDWKAFLLYNIPDLYFHTTGKFH